MWFRSQPRCLIALTAPAISLMVSNLMTIASARSMFGKILMPEPSRDKHLLTNTFLSSH